MPPFRAIIIGFGVLCLTVTASCDRGKPSGLSQDEPAKKEVLIGLIPEQNVFRQRERYLVLRNHLARDAGITMNLTSLSRYGNIIERFSRENMQGAFFGSFTYALARRQLGVEPLVRPINLDGTSTYHGYIFVRKDSGIRNAGDLKGKRFAFVERATTAGYLFPLAWLREHGVENPKAYLREMYFAGSHDAAVQAVLDKDADAGAAKNTIFDLLASENPRVRNELTILAKSGVVPQNCLAVRRDLDQNLKLELKKALLQMEKSTAGAEALKRFGARGFIETSDEDFAYVYKLAEDAGMNLKLYRYHNE